MEPVISTTEPDNVEAVLFTHLADYGISATREIYFGHFFREGFFLREGKKWSHSRDLLHLSVTKSRVEDLRISDVHVDNSIIDLGILFPRLIADMTTEFLFGESIGMIEKPDSTGFLRTLHDALVVCKIQAALDPPNSGEPQEEFCDKYSKNVKKVHAFIDEQVGDRIELPGLTSTRQGSGSLEEEEGEEEGPVAFLTSFAISPMTTDSFATRV